MEEEPWVPVCLRARYGSFLSLKSLAGIVVARPRLIGRVRFLIAATRAVESPVVIGNRSPVSFEIR